VREGEHGRNLPVLARRLLEHYPTDHPLVLYEAAPFPVGGPRVERLTLGNLADATPSPQATLYVPPLGEGASDGAAAR
jgi:hypothetical protein